MKKIRRRFDRTRIVEALKIFGVLRLKLSNSSLLIISLLSLIFLIALITRLLPMRWGFYLSEFDPHYQYRLTEHIVENGFFSWMNWKDSLSWYPQGRDVAQTSFPGLALTAAFFYRVTDALGLPITLLQLCVVFPAIMGALTCLVIYFLGKDIGGKKVGVFSAFFLSLNSSYVSRTSLGFFDDETVGIFGILLFMLFFLRSIEPKGTFRTNLFYSVAAGLSLGYLFASWGAARYAV